MKNFELFLGDSLKIVKTLNRQVHCVITSPPYFNKRKYGDSELELGQEFSINEYLSNLVELFNSIPLIDGGSIWVNLGDKRNKIGGLEMVAERFAIKMIESGWHLADNVVWAKIYDNNNGTTEGGCMIEPANCRLNGNGYETIYRFVKTKKVSLSWSDVSAIRIPRVENGVLVSKRYLPDSLMSIVTSVEGRNLHNVWRISMGQSKDKHYAVYPEELCERPIAMTCPMRVCKICGHIRTRIVEMQEYDEGRGNKRIFGKYTADEKQKSGRQDTGSNYVAKKPVTVGWSSCDHNDWISGVVLDPFSGSGTTGRVALKMGRDFIGIDLYEEHVAMANKSCVNVISYLEDKNLNPWELEQ